jgi:2-polyprenyl-3-methyl-5-hydroxy-6-metoxy-1,4-benzoquinol methylase
MSPDRTQTFFHQYANDFDAIYGNQNGMVDSIVNRLFRKSMRLRYEKSIEDCEPVQGKSVLDVGCGPGHYSITLAQRLRRRHARPRTGTRTQGRSGRALPVHGR